MGLVEQLSAAQLLPTQLLMSLGTILTDQLEKMVLVQGTIHN
jgi:hypothetical protein